MVNTAHEYLAQRQWMIGCPGYTLSEDNQRSGACIYHAIVAIYDRPEQREKVSRVCKELRLQDSPGALIRWNDHVCGSKEQAVEALRRAGV